MSSFPQTENKQYHAAEKIARCPSFFLLLDHPPPPIRQSTSKFGTHLQEYHTQTNICFFFQRERAKKIKRLMNEVSKYLQNETATIEGKTKEKSIQYFSGIFIFLNCLHIQGSFYLRRFLSLIFKFLVKHQNINVNCCSQ